MINLQQHKTEDHRRMVLWFLMMDGDQCLSEIFIKTCFEATGKDITDRALDDAINWLNERGMVSKEIIENTVFARLTDYGLDIAKGISRAIGVRDLRNSERAEIKAFLTQGDG